MLATCVVCVHLAAPRSTCRSQSVLSFQTSSCVAARLHIVDVGVCGVVLSFELCVRQVVVCSLLPTSMPAFEPTR